jgi:hypothetical protein
LKAVQRSVFEELRAWANIICSQCDHKNISFSKFKPTVRKFNTFKNYLLSTMEYFSQSEAALLLSN